MIRVKKNVIELWDSEAKSQQLSQGSNTFDCHNIFKYAIKKFQQIERDTDMYFERDKEIKEKKKRFKDKDKN